MQTCLPCKTCPAGQWPSGVCDGLSYSDTIACTPCATMATCPNTTHYYLEGNCEVEEVKCKLCDPPCNPNLYIETQACGGSNGKNRVCSPKTLCLEAQCPAGFWESTTCTDPTGPKFCTACSTCKAGEYVAQQCSARQVRALLFMLNSACLDRVVAMRRTPSACRAGARARTMPKPRMG